MATHEYAPVLGKRIRVTRLDVCGNPVPCGTQRAFIVSEGFVRVSLSSEVEDGVEILRRNAAGHLCVNERYASSFKRFSVEIEFCRVNPSLKAMITNAEEYEDYAGDVAGFTIAEGTIVKNFALELWTGLAGVACGPGQEASGYLLLPFVTGGVLGDLVTDGENAVTFSMTGGATKGGNGWGIGPYDVLFDTTQEPAEPAPLPEALDPLDHLLLIDTALAPPPVAVSPQDMPPCDDGEGEGEGGETEG